MRRIAERLAFLVAVLLIAAVAGSTAARVGPDLGFASGMEVREDVEDAEGEVAALVQAHWEAEGADADWSIRDLKVELHGHVAVATFLVEGKAVEDKAVEGTAVHPNGQDVQKPRRVTEVWVLEDGEWRETHHHDSPLELRR